MSTISAELQRRNALDVLVPWRLVDEAASPTGEAEPMVDVILRGVWDYHAGDEGTVVIPVGERVIGIGCVAGPSGATITINGGDVIPIPANRSFGIEPRGNVEAPTIIFSGTDTYVVETLR